MKKEIRKKYMKNKEVLSSQVVFFVPFVSFGNAIHADIAVSIGYSCYLKGEVLS